MIAWTMICAFACAAQPVAPEMLNGLKWRLIGPHRGGRALSATGIPGTSQYYFGSVGGGIWKTANAGETWTPILDGQPIASVGALELAPSDPRILYAGTGEADMRSDITFGDGVYKSNDGGQTWRNTGLRDSRQIGRILIHPTNPSLVYVAALGHAYGPNEERGVFRTKDGGASWQKVLFKNADTGAVDLAFEPGRPETIYAALWRARRTPWSAYPPIEGPGSGLYKSTDGGDHWTELTGHGLPAGPLGRIGIAVAPSAPHRVYALVTANDGGLFRSEDAGATWTLVSSDARIRGRSWYFSGIAVDPKDPDTVYCPNVSLYRSTDAGKTFEALKGAPGGDDYHYLWIDPTNPSHMALASDQGTVITLDRGQSWSSWYNQPTGQFYHVATDNQVPYFVYGAQQDSGTAGVASRTDFGQITFRDWYPVGGGESGAIAPDPVDPNIIFAGNTIGQLFRFDKRTGASQDIAPTARAGFGVEIANRKYRFTWTSPLVFSPQNPKALYFGSQFLLRTTDQGMSWQEVSPDLTGDLRDAKKAAAADGPASVENAKGRGYGVIYSIAPSPLRAGQIWVGTDTGLIHLTRDDGKTWTNVTPPGLGDWSKIGTIDASRHDAATAYAAIDRHRLDDYSPCIYRTHDYGRTWTKIAEGIGATAFVNAVREDPVRKGLLYAGTELGAYVSFDDGDRWQPLQLNLPVSSIRDLVVKRDDLVVATHGRAFWILDDVSPLREMDARVAGSSAYLFKPAAAMRMRGNRNKDTPLPPETPAGQNPPDGAVLYYSLKSAARSEVSIEILDRRGGLIRKYSSGDPARVKDRELPFPDHWRVPTSPPSMAAGLHRWVWDLRYPSPAGTHDYSMATAFGQDTAELPEGPMVVPGEYQVRLTVDGRAFIQALHVAMDPRVKTPASDLARQFQMGMKIWEALKVAKDPKTRAALAHLSTVVDSGDRAPTAQAVAAFEELTRGK